MNKIEKVKNMFPVKVQVTQEIIDKADVGDIFNCIGTLSLESLKIPKVVSISWGTIRGHIYDKERKSKKIFSYHNNKPIDMTEITEPTEVEFRLSS